MQFSQRISGLQPSAIREILKAPDNPDTISFAAGNPSPLTFPMAEMADIAAQLFAERSTATFQYGITEGYGPLREQTKAYLAERWRIGAACDELIVTSGAQQAIELAAKVLLNEHDTLLCEQNSFIGALNAFRSYNLNLVGVAMDDKGMDMADLEAKLAQTKARVIYTIPTFHNPCGTVLSDDRRRQLLALAERYDAVVIEDSPYCELRFDGSDVPPVKHYDHDGRVLYCGSYSKTVTPGIRVGYALGHKDLIAKMTVAKQVSDVHTNLFFQTVVSHYLDGGDFAAHIARCNALYAKRRDAMVSALAALPQVSFVTPQGGLFLWLRLPEGRVATQVCAAAKEKLLLCVPGNAFALDERADSHFIRLNFSMPDETAIALGVQRLASVLA